MPKTTVRVINVFSNRKNIVQSNLSTLNGLFDQLSEILSIGKILYKSTDAAKLQEYTLNELKKRVRKTSIPENGNATELNKEDKAEDTDNK